MNHWGRQPALQIGMVIEEGVVWLGNLIQHYAHQGQSAHLDGLDGQQALIDRTQTIGYYQQNGHAHAGSQIGIQCAVGDR
jgi:hypothetical protein